MPPFSNSEFMLFFSSVPPMIMQGAEAATALGCEILASLLMEGVE